MNNRKEPSEYLAEAENFISKIVEAEIDPDSRKDTIINWGDYDSQETMWNEANLLASNIDGRLQGSRSPAILHGVFVRVSLLHARIAEREIAALEEAVHIYGNEWNEQLIGGWVRIGLSQWDDLKNNMSEDMINSAIDDKEWLISEGFIADSPLEEIVNLQQKRIGRLRDAVLHYTFAAAENDSVIQAYQAWVRGGGYFLPDFSVTLGYDGSEFGFCNPIYAENNEVITVR